MNKRITKNLEIVPFRNVILKDWLEAIVDTKGSVLLPFLLGVDFVVYALITMQI